MQDSSIGGWSARTLAKRMCIPPSTVSSWISSGLVTPEVLGHGRKGHVIGVLGLFELLAVAELKEIGFSTQSIKKAVVNLRSLSGKHRPLADLSLMVSGDDIVWHRNEELGNTSMSLLRKPGQRLMIFPVGEKHSAALSLLSDFESSKLSEDPSAAYAKA